MSNIVYFLVKISINVLNEGTQVAIAQAQSNRELASKSIEITNNIQKKYDMVIAKYGTMLEHSGLSLIEFKSSKNKLETEINNDLMSK